MYNLCLADGSAWELLPQDLYAEQICLRFAEILQLRSSTESGCRLYLHAAGSPDGVACKDVRCWPIVQDLTGFQNLSDLPMRGTDLYDADSSWQHDLVVWLPKPVPGDQAMLWQLTLLSQVFCLDVQTRGGVLLHGALVERESRSIILAGPGGIGKSTACRRLTAPWRAWSDDLTLLVRSPRGTYFTHPWPTWSRFVFDARQTTWDVQHAIPLQAICFLVQAQQEQLTSTGAGQALCLLAESAEQALWELSWQKDPDELRRLRVQRFENLCDIAKMIPCYLLSLTLNGSFWRELETV